MPRDRTAAPRRIDRPEEGHFLIRFVKRGPLVPCRIERRRGLWGAWVNGDPPKGWSEDPWKAPDIERVYLGELTTQAEYDRRLTLKNIPGHPAQSPRTPIDPAALPPVI